MKGHKTDSVVEIDGRHLTVEQVLRVARLGAGVRLASEARERVHEGRRQVEAALRRNRPLYGVNTGVGALSQVSVPSERLGELQVNMVRSHAAGVGEPLDRETVRALLLARANGLALGHSGVRPVVVERLLEWLNAGVHPVVPCQGSVGASGDLAPLAHLTLALAGEGMAEFRGEVLPSRQALASAGLEPLSLDVGEGVALINGTQLMAAILALAVADARALVKVADVAAALTLEALGGIAGAFDERLARVRPHPGQGRSAANLRRLLAGSRHVRPAGEGPRVQDAYSLRCVPQVHGASRDAVEFVAGVVEVELNSATGNPLLFDGGPDGPAVVSGGNFHGQPLALAGDFLAIALAALAGISERRIERLVNPSLSGLPPFLSPDPGVGTGYMLAQYTAAALVSENKVLAHPAGVDSIPTSANQEDYVSMGTVAARKAARVLRHAQQVLGIELVCAAQALEFRGPQGAGRGTLAAYRAIRRHVAPLGREDRVVAGDLAAGLELVRSGCLLSEVQSHVELE